MPRPRIENGVGEWTKHEVLGRGAHGVVYRGVVVDTHESIAVKQIRTNGLGKSELQAAENEIGVLPRLRHPNVVRFLGIEQAGNFVNIFLEYLDGGSLRGRLEREGRMSEDQTAETTRKVLAGLSYLHSQNITHRDIKGANVLLSNDGNVKLADFGTSKLTNQESVVSGLKGTPHWMAPEVIRNEQSPGGWLQADVWSVGCTVIEMLTGKMPWPDIPNPMAALFSIAEGERPPIDREISPQAASFIAACCSRNPLERHTAKQLMKHPFLLRHYSSQMTSVSPTHSLDSSRPYGSACRPHPHGATDFRSSSRESSASPDSVYGDSNNDPSISRQDGYDRERSEGKMSSPARHGGDATSRPPCRSRHSVDVKQRRQPQQSRRYRNSGDERTIGRGNRETVAHHHRRATRWGGDDGGEADGNSDTAVSSVEKRQEKRQDLQSLRSEPPIPLSRGTPRSKCASFNVETVNACYQTHAQRQNVVKRGASLSRGPSSRTTARGASACTAATTVATPPSALPLSFSSPLACSLRSSIGSPESGSIVCHEIVGDYEEMRPSYQSRSIGNGCCGRSGRNGGGAVMSGGGGGSKTSSESGVGGGGVAAAVAASDANKSKPLSGRRFKSSEEQNIALTATLSSHEPKETQVHMNLNGHGESRQRCHRMHHEQKQRQQRAFLDEPANSSGRWARTAMEDSSPAFVGCVDQPEKLDQRCQQPDNEMPPLVTNAGYLNSPQIGSRGYQRDLPFPTSPVAGLQQLSISASLRPAGSGVATESGESRRDLLGPHNVNNGMRRQELGHNHLRTVVQGAREDMMEARARPNDPITGEYINIERKRVLKGMPMKLGSRRWTSNGLALQTMRTKSAGVLGSSPKLPPLERGKSSVGSGGGGEGTGSTTGSRRGVLGEQASGTASNSIGVRLITSAPTFAKCSRSSSMGMAAIKADTPMAPAGEAVTPTTMDRPPLVAQMPGNSFGHHGRDAPVVDCSSTKGARGYLAGGAGTGAGAAVDVSTLRGTRRFLRCSKLAPLCPGLSPSLASTPSALARTAGATVSAATRGGCGGGGDGSGGGSPSFPPSPSHFSGMGGSPRMSPASEKPHRSGLNRGFSGGTGPFEARSAVASSAAETVVAAIAGTAPASPACFTSAIDTSHYSHRAIGRAG